MSRLGAKLARVSDRVTLYVQRLDDATRLPRPARAEWLGGNHYRILSELPQGEVWAFEPGSIVVAERRGGLLRALSDAGVVPVKMIEASIAIEAVPTTEEDGLEPAIVQVFQAQSPPKRDGFGPLVPWWGWAAGSIVIGILIILIMQMVEG